MTRLRGRLPAALLVMPFIAALVWLPLAAALVAGAALALLGVVLLRRPAWRTWALVATSLLLGSSCIELASGVLAPRAANLGVVKQGTPSAWNPYDPVMGFRPRPGATVEMVGRYGDEVLYRQTYTIEDSGARATPGSAAHGPTYLFIGDSYLFGEGLADGETVPSQFARSLEGGARVVNLAVPGYGPNHLVRAMEAGLYDPHVVGKVEAVVTWIIPPQLPRVTGEGSWLAESPRYALDAAGRPHHTGSFLAHRLSNPLAGAAWLARSRAAGIARAMSPSLEREQGALFVALLARLGELVQQHYGAPLVVLTNGPEPDLAGQPDMQYLPVFDAVRGLGLPVISVRRMLGPPEAWAQFFIPHDGHPNARLAGLVAQALRERLARDRAH